MVLAMPTEGRIQLLNIITWTQRNRRQNIYKIRCLTDGLDIYQTVSVTTDVKKYVVRYNKK